MLLSFFRVCQGVASCRPGVASTCEQASGAEMQASEIRLPQDVVNPTVARSIAYMLPVALFGER